MENIFNNLPDEAIDGLIKGLTIMKRKRNHKRVQTTLLPNFLFDLDFEEIVEGDPHPVNNVKVINLQNNRFKDLHDMQKHIDDPEYSTVVIMPHSFNIQHISNNEVGYTLITYRHKK